MKKNLSHVEKRIEYALVHGVTDFIVEDTEEARIKISRKKEGVALLMLLKVL